jgi:hypothetical protein
MTEQIEMSDLQLLAAYHRALEARLQAQETVGKLEMEIMCRIDERGATGIPNDQFSCELVTTNSYDPQVLVRLKEILSDSDLRTCWESEHQEIVTVPESWDLRKVLPLARRYGARAVAVVDDARGVKSRRIKFAVEE